MRITTINKPRILLHSCCGPCSTSVVERLYEKYNITLLYFNPNITEKDEYERRKISLLDFIYQFNKDKGFNEPVSFIEGLYETPCFYKAIKGLEKEAEGGERCEKCFELRLSVTAMLAKNLKFDAFGTTLSVSPRKNYTQISLIGKHLSRNVGVDFIDENFKKKAGFQRSAELSKEYKLYRQNYCGCEFSK